MNAIAAGHARILLILAGAAVLVTAWWAWQGRAVDLVVAPGGRVQCVSYAPSSERHETLVDQGVIVPPERIERDLVLLAERFDCVRTYSQSNGLSEVPRIAGRLGLKVLMGVWLGRDVAVNEREIASAIEIAQRDRAVLTGIVVGNEVLLRGELPPEALRGYIERVRTATGLPVTYADVWEFWRRYRQPIESAVDFITIHILPFWEDEPVAVAQAVPHVRDIYQRMQADFPGRELLIGETGWPSAGRQRQGALPGRVNQARFIREFLAFTADAGIRYNVIEAFDQPWKRRQEGAVGGYWGLYDHQRREKFSLVGPVVEEPRWPFALLAGAALGAIFWIAAWAMAPLNAGQSAVLVLTGYVTGCVLASQVKTMWLASRTSLEWAIGIAWTLLALVTTWWLARRLGSADTADRANPWTRRLRFVWLYSATIVSLLLVLDSRYRDFPIALFVLPVAGFVLLRLTSRDRFEPVLEERIMAGWLLAAAVLTPVIEGVINLNAWAWVTLCLAFGIAVLGLPRTRTA